MKRGESLVTDIAAMKLRRRRRTFFFVSGMSLYVVVVAVLWVFFRSPFFVVRDVRVEGNVHVPSGDVISLVEGPAFSRSFLDRVLGLHSMFAWPSGVASDTLRFVPQISSLSIQKNYRSGNILIHVTERSPVGIWCEMSGNNTSSATPGGAEGRVWGTECFWFDEEGVLYKRSFDAEGGLITVVHDYSQHDLGLFSRVLPEPELAQNLYTVFDVLAGTGLSLGEIRVNDVNLQELEVDTYAGTFANASGTAAGMQAPGPTLYFSLRFPAVNDLPVIQSLKTKPGFGKLQYIDFRVENRAYYK